MANSRPTVPATCDHCHQKLDKVLVCGRCKAWAYCSAECQAEHWKEHRTGCSPLPAGTLSPKPAVPDGLLCNEGEVLASLLSQILIEWQEKDLFVGPLAARVHPLQPDRPPARLTRQERVARLLGPAFKQLATYDILPALACDDYPGRRKPRKDDLAHRLVQIERVLLLHQLSHATPAGRAKLLSALDPRDEAYPEADADDNEGAGPSQLPSPDGKTAAAKVRLHGPKVLAAPDKLSAGEYDAITQALGDGWLSVGPEDHAQSWVAMAQIARQCANYPELLRYAPESGARVGWVPKLTVEVGRYGEPGAPERPW